MSSTPGCSPTSSANFRPSALVGPSRMAGTSERCLPFLPRAGKGTRGVNDRPKPPFPVQKQYMPGLTAKMQPVPDHGEKTYKGSGRLAGKKAVITGADSGIGRAVAIAYAREGTDVLISYHCEDEDAAETKKWVEEAGRKAVLVRGDIQDPNYCRDIIEKAVSELSGIDILINNAAHQASF